jgi:PAS domain S-box-containing protein
MQHVNILLVEDSHEDEKLIMRTLAQENLPVHYIRVCTETDFCQALERQAWDVIISDYQIPGFGGVVALEIARNKAVTIPFIMVSGTMGEQIAVEVMRQGADDYLMKDHLHRLGTVVQRVMREADTRRKKKQAKEQIRYQAYLLENVDEGIISVDTDFRVKTWNRGAEKIFHITAAESIGKPLSELLSINFHLPASAATEFAVLEQVPTWKGEVTIVATNRQKHSVFLTLGRLDGFENFTAGYILICKDIEEIVAAQHRLIESQSYVASAVENTVDAIFALNLNHELLYFNTTFNKRFKELFQTDARIGLCVLDFVSEDEKRTMIENVERVQQGEKFRYDYSPALPGRTDEHFEISVSSIYGQDRQVVGVTYLYRDITEKKKIARQIADLQSEILTARMEEQRIQSAALLEGQEQERARLSRELHDGLGQMLNVLKMELYQSQASPAILKMADSIIAEVKQINKDLVPLALQDFGLETSIQQLINHIQGSHKSEIYYYSNLQRERFHPRLEVSIYRILQEALTNAVKYARADHISVQLTRQPDCLLIMIEDDGVGFDLAAQQKSPQRGYGLLNIQFRAEALNGQLGIDTQPGRGCVIHFSVPV